MQGDWASWRYLKVERTRMRTIFDVCELGLRSLEWRCDRVGRAVSRSLTSRIGADAGARARLSLGFPSVFVRSSKKGFATANVWEPTAGSLRTLPSANCRRILASLQGYLAPISCASSSLPAVYCRVSWSIVHLHHSKSLQPCLRTITRLPRCYMCLLLGPGTPNHSEYCIASGGWPRIGELRLETKCMYMVIDWEVRSMVLQR
jgi:hypothetical protein